MFGGYLPSTNEAMLAQFGERVDLAIITAAVLIVLFVGYITLKEIRRKHRSKNTAELFCSALF